MSAESIDAMLERLDALDRERAALCRRLEIARALKAFTHSGAPATERMLRWIFADSLHDARGPRRGPTFAEVGELLDVCGQQARALALKGARLRARRPAPSSATRYLFDVLSILAGEA